MMSHFTQILIIGNKFPLLKFLSNYLSTTAGSNTFEMAQRSWGFSSIIYIKPQLTKITLSSLQLLNIYNIFPSTLYMETTIFEMCHT